MRLERGGAFGPLRQPKYDTSKRRHWTYSTSIPDHLRTRELDFRRPLRDTLGDLTVPNSAGVEVAQFTDPVYSGQYSADGRFFYAACKDYRVYVYDTATAPRAGAKSITDQAEPGARSLGRFWSHRTSLKVQKIAQGSAANCSWTLTDAELSDDSQWLIYSSITPRVHMVRTGYGGEWEADQEQHTLDFAAGAHYGFGVRRRLSLSVPCLSLAQHHPDRTQGHAATDLVRPLLARRARSRRRRAVGPRPRVRRRGAAHDAPSARAPGRHQRRRVRERERLQLARVGERRLLCQGVGQAQPGRREAERGVRRAYGGRDVRQCQGRREVHPLQWQGPGDEAVGVRQGSPLLCLIVFAAD